VAGTDCNGRILTAPLYAAAKIPIYLAFLIRQQKHWVRTERDIAQT